MSNIFDKFDAQTDLEALKKDVADAEVGNTGDYKEVPCGTYEVSLVKIELKESKNGKPMVAMRFKILEGAYKDQLIFVNQVVASGFGIHKCNELLKAMSQFCKSVSVEFKSYNQYNELLNSVYDAVTDKYSYALSMMPNEKNKDFKDYEIVEVFEEEVPF